MLSHTLLLALCTFSLSAPKPNPQIDAVGQEAFQALLDDETEKSIKCWKRAIQLGEADGDSTARIANDYYMLASAQTFASHFRDSLGNFEHARKLQQKLGKNGESALFQTTKSLVKVYAQLGNGRHAEELARICVAKLLADPESQHSEAHFALLGYLYADCRCDEDAERCLRCAVRMAEAENARGRNVMWLRRGRVEGLIRLGHHREAAEEIQILYKQDDPATSPLLQHGLLLCAQKDHRAAAKTLREFIAADAKRKTSQTLNVGAAQIAIADCYRAFGQPSEARDSLSFALRLIERELGPEHPRIADILTALTVLTPKPDPAWADRIAAIRKAERTNRPRGLDACFPDLKVPPKP